MSTLERGFKAWAERTSKQLRAELKIDAEAILDTFPEYIWDFIWDVKVHMLMPGMYPGIPGWHTDFTPRIGGIQRPLLRLPAPIYMWLSGPPLAEFRGGFMRAGEWLRFDQHEEHRAVPSADFCWRGLIRATHATIYGKPQNHQRRHSQVYLVNEDYKW